MRAARRYRTGIARLDETLESLALEYGGRNADLLLELLTTDFKFVLDEAGRGDMKLVNAALKELRYAFRVFAPYHQVRKVTIFGSARTESEHPDYATAREFAHAICHAGWMVVTGAGPGIMEAGHLGAGAEHSFGVNIRLPFEDQANTVIAADPKLVNFRYFFTRKLAFLKNSDAFVLFPGGFGTMDEAFELLVLVQTGKSLVVPIVLLEAPGGDYWQRFEDFIRRQLLDRDFISPADLALIWRTDTVDAAVAEIGRFYSNYDSQRYVDGRLVLRLRTAPGPERLAELNATFSDLLLDGEMEVIDVTPSERADGDHLLQERIAFRFNRRHAGRLRQLINALNDAPV